MQKCIYLLKLRRRRVSKDIVFAYLPTVWWKLINHKVNWPNAVSRRPEKGYPISIDLKTNVDFTLLFLIWCTLEKPVISKMLSAEQSILNVINGIWIALASCNWVLEKIKDASLLKKKCMQIVLLAVAGQVTNVIS